MKRIRKRPVQQRSAATWDAILDAAAQVFEAHGYQGATTNRIAERAGVSIGSLYQYFPNKDALLWALAERHLASGSDILRLAFADLGMRQPGLAETLDILIKAVVNLHRHEPIVHRLLFDQAPRCEELLAALRVLEQGVASLLAAQLQRLGCGGPQPQLRALLIVQGVEAQVHGPVLAPTSTQTIDDCVRELRCLWLGALSLGQPDPC